MATPPRIRRTLETALYCADRQDGGLLPAIARRDVDYAYQKLNLPANSHIRPGI
jgi:hypothetical protein